MLMQERMLSAGMNKSALLQYTSFCYNFLKTGLFLSSFNKNLASWESQHVVDQSRGGCVISIFNYFWTEGDGTLYFVWLKE
jgi:hypothetical protein